MTLVQHAKNELHLAGMWDADSDYDGMIADAVLELVKTFASQGHSGFSADYTLELFSKVARWKTLTPITDDPRTWNLIDAEMAGREGLYQSTRSPDCFSYDGGATYWSTEDETRKIYVSERVTCQLDGRNCDPKDHTHD